MGDSRDLDQKISSSFEIEDNSGLELSLGLAFGRKGSFGVKEHDERKEKEKHDKTCLGNITFKDFGQRSLGDKKDNGKQHSGPLPQQREIFWTSLQTSNSKELEKFTRTRINEVQFPGFGEPWHAAETSKLPNGSPQQIRLNVGEKSTQAECSVAPPNKINTDTVPNHLQFSLHVAAGRGQFAQSNFPTHFLGTFGNGGSATTGHPIVQSCAGTSVMQNSIQLVGTQSSSPGLKASLQLDTTQGKQFIGMENVNTDQHQRSSVAQQHWQDDTLEQQKIREMSAQKWQEARKKRKLLIEEQKQQKNAKRQDDRAGPHGFRRPGSNTWVHGWEPPTLSVADVERSKTTQDTREGDNRVSEMFCTFQQVRDRYTKDNELETDEESSESQQESNISDNSSSPSAKIDEVGKSSSIAEEGNSPKRSIKNPTEAQQCMTVQTHDLQRKEETEEQECKMFTACLDKRLVPSPTVGSNSNSALANMPTTSLITITNTTLPFSVPSFPVMPAPYSLPTPVPNHPNVPFPVGYPFVYLMQYPPPAVDVTNCTAARPPIYPNGYQLPLGYAPFQLPMNEGSSSWVPVLRPQQSPPLAPNFGGPRTSLEPKEDETKVSQG